MQLTLECQKRPEGSKPNALRSQGLIPASLYGHQGAEAVSLVVGAKDAQILLKKASVNNTLIDLNIPELNWNGKALIREVQSHPWKRTIYHLSFFSLINQKKVELVVPLKIHGEAIGVKQSGGVLDLTISELKIACAPDKIPEAIDINVSNFDVGSSLHVGEVVLPEGVVALDDPGRIVFSIVTGNK
jgi:large subunit ribosomal protein L25